MQSWKPKPGEQTKHLKSNGLSVDALKAAGFKWGRSQSWEGPETEEARQIAAKLNGVILAEFMDQPKAVAAKECHPLPVAIQSTDKIVSLLYPAKQSAERANALADSFDKKAEDGERDRQDNTTKRFAQAQSKRREAQHFRRAAKLCRDFAAAPIDWKPNKDEALLATSFEPKQVQNGYHAYYVDSFDQRKTDNHAVLALRAAYLSGAKPEETPEQKAQRLSAAVKFSPIPGFFPTPAPVIAKMIEKLGPFSFAKTLEPSAGKGDIADALKSYCVRPDVCEINQTLREILKTKGHNIVAEDFTECHAAPVYDFVIMNPPFERGQDRQHIRHAFGFLAPGGRLVALCSASSPQNAEFCEWLHLNGAEIEDLPPGSFSGADAFRQTGVSVCMITIDKN